MNATQSSVDEYLSLQPAELRGVLQEVRAAIKSVLPNASETISYAMPTFRIDGKNVVHYAGYRNHVGFYATPDGHAEFEQDLSRYKRGKGSVQFPLDQPMPIELIKRIALFRANQITGGT